MSWKDRLDNTIFTITTGDGKVYTPLWRSGETQKEFNVSVFDFISLPGSLISRKQVKARSFPLVFWFQGDDNIDQSEAFDLSANDPRAWTIKHPFYGDIIGQPLSINRKDTDLNITEINVDFWETITDSLPKKLSSIPDVVASHSVKLIAMSPVVYANKVNLQPADVSMVRENTQKINLNISSVLDSSTYSDYQKVKNSTFARIDNMIDQPAEAIRGINELIEVPASFGVSVTTRLTLLKALYNEVKSILGIKNSRNNKAYFEAIGAAVITAMAISVVNPLPDDYVTRKQIEEVSDSIVNIYEDYLHVLDESYISVTDPLNNFSGSSETQTIIQDTIIDTVANLNDLAFNAKQERVTILDRDSNLIVLTHKYLGLDPDDKNLEQFRAINNIKNKSLFLLKKGRQIKYLV